MLWARGDIGKNAKQIWHTDVLIWFVACLSRLPDTPLSYFFPQVFVSRFSERKCSLVSRFSIDSLKALVLFPRKPTWIMIEVSSHRSLIRRELSHSFEHSSFRETTSLRPFHSFVSSLCKLWHVGVEFRVVLLLWIKISVHFALKISDPIRRSFLRSAKYPTIY